MTLVCLLIAWGLSIGLFAVIVIHSIGGFRQIRRLHSIPCSKCQYFTNSCYLKCTVHPDLACSEAAIDCRDFVLQSQAVCQDQAKKKAFAHNL